MKVEEVTLMWKPEPRKRRAKKRLKLWKASVLLLLAGMVVGYFAGYEPPKPMRPPLRYHVQPGDTLWDVATMYGPKNVDIRETYWQIAEDNHVQDGNLQPGQVLLIHR